ncbi:DUF3530 family protein [Alteromonas oceanisediminis]|uniref:DUF3530 family protein n=1 Tax=Alteromonas oceanisediminis TaxID=2836180 RepID=UPI001BDAB9BA|nr:DUF3530 family protein [Alteromonas oceanisediminis]MBT0585368.1 DUF3530 family protein [Alteromonas oceanisediminis]
MTAIASSANAQETLSSSALFTQDIQASMPLGETQVIVAGTDEVPVKIAPATAPLTRGVAIIVTESLQGIFGTQGVSSVAEQLNGWGWTTLTMPAPAVLFSSNHNPTAITDVNARSAMPPIHPESLTRYSLALSQRLEAAFAEIQSTPGYRLLISHGIASAGLIRLYAQGNVIEPDGLVVAGPFWPQRDLNDDIPMQLAQTTFPVLDLTNEWDNRWSVLTEKQRKVRAATELKMHYRQRDINGTQYNTQQYQSVGKNIYGWMTFLGW